jgi:hypothetical protein
MNHTFNQIHPSDGLSQPQIMIANLAKIAKPGGSVNHAVAN